MVGSNSITKIKSPNLSPRTHTFTHHVSFNVHAKIQQVGLLLRKLPVLKTSSNLSIKHFYNKLLVKPHLIEILDYEPTNEARSETLSVVIHKMCVECEISQEVLLVDKKLFSCTSYSSKYANSAISFDSLSLSLSPPLSLFVLIGHRSW